MPAVFSDPITSGGGGVGREASANQQPLATNRYIPTADGHINLRGDLTAVLNQRDPLNLDNMAEGFERFDTLIPDDIGQPAQIALPVPSPFDPLSIIPVIPPNGEEITQDTTTINTHDPITTQHTLPTGVEDNRPVTLRDMRDIMTHSMREFQHSIQQMVSQQIETRIRNIIPIPSQHFLPPSSSRTNSNQNTRSTPPTQQR